MTSAKWLAGLAFGILIGAPGLAPAQSQFPFDSELILDTAPMRGSKRIPNMDVDAKGLIALEMWCNRIEGQFVVAAVAAQRPVDEHLSNGHGYCCEHAGGVS